MAVAVRTLSTSTNAVTSTTCWMGITASRSPARSGSVGSWRTSPRSGENHRAAGLGADLTAARQQLTELLQGYHGGDEPGNSQTESPRLQFGLQFTTVRRRPGKSGLRRWSSLNRSVQPRSELLMRLGLLSLPRC